MACEVIESQMETVERTVIANASAAAAYERWTQVEDFPAFIPGLAAVHRLGDERFAWVWEFEGHRMESVSEVTLRIPQRRIAWRSVSGAENSGVVSFEPVEGNKVQITLSMKYSREGDWDSAEAVAARLEGHLEGFKKLLESSAADDIAKNSGQGF
jgi:uncharacterized membrane protein